MRLLVTVLTLLFFFSLLGFLMTNLEARVDVVVWDTSHADVPVYLLVVLSALAGCLVVGIIAVAEGAHIRLANRRLRREIHQLETELNYLRTQPPAGSRAVEDSTEAESGKGGPSGGAAGRDDRDSFPTGPVYGAEGAELDDPDDDIYSGGRAV